MARKPTLADAKQPLASTAQSRSRLSKRDSTRPSIDGERQFSALLEEYKILKAEASSATDTATRSVGYVQLYGFFLVALTGAYFGGISSFITRELIANIPSMLWLCIILSGAMFLFLLYAHITQTSFKFIVLRNRLSCLEQIINSEVKNDIYLYERWIAQRAFSSAFLANSAATPNAWIRVLTLGLFSGAVISVLVLVSSVFSKSSPDYALFSAATILYFAIALVVDDVRTIKFFDTASLSGAEYKSGGLWSSITPYIANYIALIIVFYAFFAEAFESESRSQISAGIDSLFIYMESFSIWITHLFIFVYETFCGFILFTPSELPLKLADHLGLWPIILVAASGKALGAVALFQATRWYVDRNLDGPSRTANRMVSAISSPALSYLASVLGERPVAAVKRGALPAIYLICQAVPFFPMRSATVGYAVARPESPRSAYVVAACTWVGTFPRMLLFWWLIGIGS